VRPQPPHGQRERDDPNEDDAGGSDATGWPFFPLSGFGPELVHEAVGNQAHGQQDASRNYDDVIKVPEHRHEVGNQIDGTKSVGGDGGREDLRVTRYARLAWRDPYGNGVTFDRPPPLSGTSQHATSLAERLKLTHDVIGSCR